MIVFLCSDRASYVTGRRLERGRRHRPDHRLMTSFEERIRALEESLSPFAVRSLETRGRELPEEPCGVRTPFQRDRDRIVHSKPFRRLKGKTQVFIDPEGDHYRTRMTHTLETTAISRVVARALRLNEDLTEAIGLGHDMGHTPFGHAGEDALDEAVPRAVRPSLPPQRAVAPDRTLAQPHARGLRRDPHAHRRARAGDARGEDRAARRPRRVHQPRHRRRGAVRAARRGRPAARGDRGPRPDGLGADRHARPRHRRVVGGRRRHPPVARRWGRRCSRCARSCSSASTSGRRRRRSTRRRTRSSRAIFDHLVERGDDVDEIVDYIAGMTDRFALDLRRLSLSAGERALDLARCRTSRRPSGRRRARARARPRHRRVRPSASIRRPACLRRFASTSRFPADAMMSAAASSSPARMCSITLRHIGKIGPARCGDGIAELVTDAELVREWPEPRQRAVQPDLANQWRHLRRERARFVELIELGVERRGESRASRASWNGSFLVCTCSNDRSWSRSASSRSPRASQSAERTSRAKHSSVCGDPASHSAMNVVRRLERAVPAPEHEVEPDPVAADEADARGVSVALAETRSPRRRARPCVESRPRTSRRRRGC